MKFFLSLLLCSTLSFCFAQEWPVSAIPEEMLENANQVVRQEMIQLDIKTLSQGRQSIQRTITLLNKRSTEQDVVIFYSSATPPKKIKITLFDAAGKQVQQFYEKDMKDYPMVDGFSLYQDTRYKVLPLTYANYPFTVRYEYEQELQGIQLAALPDWYIQSYNSSVQNASYMITYPDEMDVHYRPLNIAIEPTARDLGKQRKLLYWSAQQLAAIERQPYSPPSAQQLPRLQVVPRRFKVERYDGSMASWADYGSFMHTLYTERSEVPDGLRREVHDLVAGAGTPEERIARLYRHLQQKMRYVSIQLGLGGWQPFSVDQVYETSYGDCKALTNYMRVMLQEAGITAYPALIDSGDEPEQLDEAFVNPAFNHVVLFLPETEQWLECTSSHYPVGYIGSGNANRQAFIFHESGGQLLSAPKLDTTNNQGVISARLQLQKDGQAILETTSHLTGEPHEVFRYLKHYKSREEQEKWLRQNYFGHPVVQLSDWAMELDDQTPTAIFEYQADIGKTATMAGKRLFLPLNSVAPLDKLPSAVETRTQPLYLPSASRDVLQLTVQLPDGVSVEALPEIPTLISSPFGTAHIELTQQEGVLKIQRNISWTAGKWPPEEYENFRNFVKTIIETEQQKIVLLIDK